jgi:nucleoid-associated protein YgaU
VGDQAPVALNVSPTSVKLDKKQNTIASKTNRQAATTNSGSGGIQTTTVGMTQYKGASAGTCTITGATLGSSTGQVDISPQIQTLYSALAPPVGATKTSQPPLVKFVWGSWRPLPNAYISSLSITITDQLDDGTPVQADLTTLVLTEAPTADPGQNPTSGAHGSRKTHTIVAGDSLASISYAAYGRPDLWRALADINGIDDPLRLQTGTELLIPPRDFAKGYK